MANPYDSSSPSEASIIMASGAQEQQILANGWKNKLGSQFVDMAMQAQKEAAVERNRQAKATEARGVLEESRAYKEGQADDALILEDETAADAQLEAPTTSAGIARRRDNQTADLANTKTEAGIKKTEAETKYTNERSRSSSKTPMDKTSRLYVDANGSPLLNADIDAGYKAATKGLPNDVQAKIDKINLDREMDLDEYPLEETDWFGNTNTLIGKELTEASKKRKEIEAKYDKQLEAYNIDALLEAQGIFKKGSTRKTSKTSTNSETIAERTARLTGK